MQQPSRDIDALYRRAEEERPVVEAALERAASRLGGEVDLRIKNQKRVIEKIVQRRHEGKRGYSGANIWDYLGARIIVPDPEAALSPIMRSLRRAGYEIVGVDNAIEHPKPFGYSALHLDVRAEDGFLFEVQVHFPEGRDLTSESHETYEKWRRVIVEEGEVPANQREAYEADLEHFENRWAEARRALEARRRSHPGEGSP